MEYMVKERSLLYLHKKVRVSTETFEAIFAILNGTVLLYTLNKMN